jgi:ABC-type branched-subunit amino acid transport system ATPase component
LSDAGSDALLEASGVTRLFGGVRAVDDVDFKLRRGTVHGLIGPNGAGKTTLLNLIAGALALSAGALRFCGHDMARRSTAERARMGVRRTFQNVKLFADMTAVDNVAVGLHASTRCGFFGAVLRTARCSREERSIRERCIEALRFVGLDGRAQTRAGALPYGHRRLLEIARAVVAMPLVILLDEPAAGLNEIEARHISQLISSIRDAGMSVVLVEHHMDVVMQVCDEVTVLNHGRRLASGTPAQIRGNPEVIEAYLGRPADTPDARA